MITNFSMGSLHGVADIHVRHDGDAVRLWSAEREPLEDFLNALELAGWAETAPEPVSGLELLSGAAETVPRSNRERYAPIVRGPYNGWQVDVTRSDLALALSWEALNG